MAGRHHKTTVDYFPHYINHGQTIFILESLYGNDGYAAWFKLLELLGSAENHFIDINNPETKAFVQAKMNLKEDVFKSFLKSLCSLNAIVADIFDTYGIIFSENFVSNLSSLYARRGISSLTKEAVLDLCKHQYPEKPISTGEKPQSKVKYSKGKESKVKEEYCPAKSVQTNPNLKKDVLDDFNQVFGTGYKPSTEAIAKLINARIAEGHTLEDFKLVHQKMKQAWEHDPKMKSYLRPQTLYTGKFSSYMHYQVSAAAL